MSDTANTTENQAVLPLPHYQTCATDRITLSYLEWGTRGDTPVLLLHGLGDTAAVWAGLGAFLGDHHYHVVAVDMRGHGESDKPEIGYDFDTLIVDLEGLLEHLGWDAAHILGHSWTGKLVPLWMRSHSHRFLSAILIDPFFISSFPGIFRLTFPLLYKVLPFLQMMGPFASRNEAEAKAKQQKQYRGWSPLQQTAFSASIEPKSNGQWGSKFTTAARDGVFEEILTISGLTEEIPIPTLFLKPIAGLNRSSFQLAPYRRYLKALDVRSVPGNHWAFLVEPDACNQVIVDFLKTH